MRIQANLLKSFDDLSCIVPIVLLTWAEHLHIPQNFEVGVFLEEDCDDNAILEVLIEVGNSPLFQQNLEHTALHPETEDAFAGRHIVRPLQVSFWNIEDVACLARKCFADMRFVGF